jgi:hypothetical protein
MKTESDRNELLSDILFENGSMDFRNASLQRTLLSARRHRRARMGLRAAAAAAVCAALFAVPFLQRNSSRQSLAENTSHPSPQVQTVPGTKIQVVNDDELLAMFPDRPVAIVGPPENRQFVFLDEQRAHPDGATRNKDKL